MLVSVAKIEIDRSSGLCKVVTWADLIISPIVVTKIHKNGQFTVKITLVSVCVCATLPIQYHLKLVSKFAHTFCVCFFNTNEIRIKFERNKTL